MKTNTKPNPHPAPRTHEGAVAARLTPEQELRRSVMATMLWEGSFYEEGVEIADRIADLVGRVNGKVVSDIAVEARTKMKLRHVPLLLARSLVKIGHPMAASTIEQVIQRPDEITELMAIYWKDGRTPLAHSLKKGLARAFEKFDEYALAKYDRDEKIKLRDVLFMVHGKTKDIVTAKGRGDFDVVKLPAIGKKGYQRGQVLRHPHSLADKIVLRTLATPDTWEVKLTEAKTPEAKREVWLGLLERKHLGALALLRNLRNMKQVGVPDETVRHALGLMKVDRVLPFRFLTAARYAPALEPDLEAAMFRCLADQERLKGQTVIVVDVSGSMEATVSDKSEVSRIDAACGLAILLREIGDIVNVVAFSTQAKVIPARRGMALRDAINNSMEHGGTNTRTALALAEKNFPTPTRIIVITDEQSHQSIGAPWGGAKGYFLNVAPYRNGIGYGPWIHCDGWTEALIEYIRAAEAEENGK